MGHARTRHTRKRLAQLAAAALLLSAATALPASALPGSAEGPADGSAKPLSSPAEATAFAKKLGADRTGGTYVKDGRTVVAVTDKAAAQSVRDAGGTPELVARSTAELNALHRKLDALGNIPNTSWGVEASANQVSVDVFDGAPAAGRAKIEKLAQAHPDAIRVNRLDTKLKFKATDLRGANGITSSGWLCSAGFNTKNSSGTIYTLTAGHCVPGTGNTWYMAHNNAKIGTQTAYTFGSGTSGTTGTCDGSTRACDWASIKADVTSINPLGTVRYWGGDYHQIESSRFPTEGEHIDRIGVSSQDLTGNVTKTSTTVNIDGETLYGMMETNNCALGGDSGGPAVHGTVALGMLSGGTSETVCTSSSSGTYRNYFTRVQTVLNERGLHVY
ncbi:MULTISPECIES: S1 family peptidase [unclassified Streptomyces]|uniref:S1 family peptidase n=1 Tax=unclassified Streptomyces TaxID=2593676 RepID=UPI00278C3D62|nr:MULTISPECIES: S1 family peptidase [unclassified Streptomyces]